MNKSKVSDLSPRERWLAHPERYTGLRQIDVAAALGLSEGEWVHACLGHESAQLVSDPKRFLEALPSLGEVMALTRNASAVHEKVGVYDHIGFFDRAGMAQVVNHDVDLRIFLRHWHRMYAVTLAKGDALQHSLQVFDREGRAVHKVFMRPDTNVEAWDRLVSDLRVEPEAAYGVESPSGKPAKADPSTVSMEVFREAWDQLTDTHEFFGLLKRFNLSRPDALKLAGGDRAVRVEPACFTKLLRLAAERGAPIMVFVGNRGCIQIHTGPVHKVMPYKEWFNVMDPGFNLHLKLPRIASVWVVRKPTSDGLVTSMELYDYAGDEIAMLFGERKPGQRERDDWRALISDATTS